MDGMRIFAVLFGLFFVAIGVAGFMPSYTPDGNLFGYFSVDTMHNLVHVLTGVIALLAASSRGYATWFFRIFGILYGALAIAGFVYGENGMMMHINMADNVLHLVIAIVALYIGFIFKRRSAA